MGRSFGLIILLIISLIIYLIKAGAGKVTGKDVKFQDESRKVMEKTARGINWMNEQWEKARSNASEPSTSSRVEELRTEREKDFVDSSNTVLTCPKCSTKLRVPSGLKLLVTCNGCGTEFRVET